MSPVQLFKLFLITMIHSSFCSMTTDNSTSLNIYLESLEVSPDEHLFTLNFQSEINKMNQNTIKQKNLFQSDLNLTIHFSQTYPYKHQYLIQDDVSNCIYIPNLSNFRYTIQPSLANVNTTFNNYIVLHPISENFYSLRLSVDKNTSFHFIDSIMNWYYPESHSDEQNMNGLTLFRGLYDLTNNETFTDNCECRLSEDEHTSTFDIYSKRIELEMDTNPRTPILSVIFKHNSNYQQWFSNACNTIKHHPDPLRGLLSAIEYVLFITNDQSYYNEHLSISFYGKTIWGNKNKEISYSFSDQILSTCNLEEGYAQFTLELNYKE